MGFVFNSKNIWHWVGTFFGVGLMRPAPGTWGTLAALPFGIALLLAQNIFLFSAVLFLVTFIGFLACDKICAATGPKHDPKEIVIDEVAGMLLALSAAQPSALDLVAAFIIFRALDILKPFPIGWVDKNKTGAIGIMGDDLIAGFITAALLTGGHYAGLG